jgi:Acetyltransferase (GNAT) domain
MDKQTLPRIVTTVEDFNDEIRAAYIALLPHQSKAVAAGKLDWKFKDNPAGKGKVAVARLDGEIVGLNAFMAGTFAGAAGASYPALQSMDTIVTPAARGQGVFHRLVDQFQTSASAGLIYGFPNMSSSPGFFGKLGWHHVGPAPMLVKPLRSGVFLKRLHRLLPDFPLPTLLPAMPDMEEITQFDARVDGAWDKFAARNNVQLALRRDAAYLNWRLFGHPSVSYRAFTIDHRAYAAMCIEEKHGGRIGYIMDVFGDDDAVRTLVNGLSLLIRNAGADAIFAWNLPHVSNRAAYRAAGYLSLPDRIRPIRLNFGGRPLAVDIDGFANPNNWHISYLDSDTV